MTQRRFVRRRPRYADVAATLALVVAMGGTAFAAAELPKDSVGSRQLRNGAVTTVKIHEGAVSKGKLGAGAVTSSRVGKGAVTGSKLHADAVTSSKVADESLTLADLLGTDISGQITLSVPADACIKGIVAVPGASVGQVPLLSFTGDVGVPPSVVVSPGEVTSDGQITFNFCNLSQTAISESGIGVRVVTFG